MAATIARADWHLEPGFDLLGEPLEPPLGARQIDVATYERLRVEAGWPKMGAELTEDTIPAEAGIVREAVSFTKGCYTGQELVARIDSRGGHVPRLLRHVRVGRRAAAGARLELDAKDVGWLTSVAGDLALGLRVAGRRHAGGVRPRHGPSQSRARRSRRRKPPLVGCPGDR